MFIFQIKLINNKVITFFENAKHLVGRTRLYGEKRGWPNKNQITYLILK